MPTAPTGTVTFLFTDIEGSTLLARAHPAEWESARARHHSIIRAACEAHQGHVFQIVGDAFCIAFSNASDAVSAALDAQRDLASANKDQGAIGVRVRMGIHAGTAEFRDGNYIGYLTLAQAQRVTSVAHGGQTLVSNAAAVLLAGQLPAGLALRDMGEHRLKGLPNPERLWQLTGPDGPQDFPLLQSLNAVPNNLPFQVTSFIGRERELSELQRLLPTTRLLTLTGTGGTGKTRLSLQIAAEMLERFPDGAWFCELAPLSDPGLLLDTIAAVLGVREEQGRPLLATLADWLRPKRLLLILDNCEHLVEPCARFADAVIHASRETRILASSREALGIAGELAWRVPSLEVPDPKEAVTVPRLGQYAAVRLFIERARFANAAFAVTDANAAAVTQICYRLDGIPLAIELAAARVKSLRVEQIAERLDDRFRLLTGGSRTALPRQQTLRSLIDWSHSLLPDPERVLMRRLSVFAGGWTVEAAEQVTGSPWHSGGVAPSGATPDLPAENVLDILARLVDKSLVVLDEQSAAPRYRMLETMRQYACEKLFDAGESEPARDKHLAFYLGLAEQTELALSNGQAPAEIPRLRLEHDNLRAALEWACQRETETARRLAGLLHAFWIASDLLNEGATWYGRVLGLDDSNTPTRGTALALFGAGAVSAILFAVGEAREHLERSVAQWQALDDKPRLAEALNWLAYTMMLMGQPEAACALYEDNEPLFRKCAAAPVLQNVLSYWGRVLAMARGDFASAKRLHDESLAIGLKRNDIVGLGVTYMNLGFWAQQQGDNEAAMRYHLDGLACRRQVGSKYAIGISLFHVGDIAFLQGEYAEARPLYEESLAMDRAVGHQLGVAQDLTRLGHLAARLGEMERASELFTESLQIYRERENHEGMALCLLGFAGLLRAQGNALGATRLLASELLPAALQGGGVLIDRIEYERLLAALRAALGEANFNSAWAEGRALTVEQAIELAHANN